METRFTFEQLNILNKAIRMNNDILYFCSSVNNTIDENDIDIRRIDQILNDNLPYHSIAGIYHPAFNLDIYSEFIKYIIEKKSDQVMIIPINLRSFSPAWDMRPHYQFIKEKNILNGFPIRQNILGFINYSEKEFMNKSIYHNKIEIGKIKDFDYPFENIQDKPNGFIYQYMQEFDSNHRKLKSLVEIINLSKKYDLDIIFYITPIDITMGKSLKIKNFEKTIFKHLEIVKDILINSRVHYIDLSSSLDSTFFSYKIKPNEHLNFSGRQYVADELARFINESFTDN